jgi:hypothetical protein
MSDEMEFVESIVVSSFDIIWIVSELMVDGIGYAAWVVFALVCLFLELSLIC